MFLIGYLPCSDQQMSEDAPPAMESAAGAAALPVVDAGVPPSLPLNDQEEEEDRAAAFQELLLSLSGIVNIPS
jgi:hypothetical protein